jgi:hypothetical protein
LTVLSPVGPGQIAIRRATLRKKRRVGWLSQQRGFTKLSLKTGIGDKKWEQIPEILQSIFLDKRVE